MESNYTSNLGNKEIMAKNIRRYMEQKNVSRTDICKALDIKYTTFCDWINAKTYPRIDKIEMMANYFGIEKSDLVESPKPKDQDDTIDTADSISDVYLNFAKDAQDNGISPDDIKMVLEILKSMKDGK